MAESADDFSRAFYPFLHDDQPRQEAGADLKFSLLEKVAESVAVKNRFFAEQQEQILAVARAIAQSFQQNGKLLICGNGGSATDAQHIAVEFMHPVTVGRKALPAICLANDNAMLTAVANDVGVADIFSRQVIALGRAGDLLLTISTSGNSTNLIEALRMARRMSLTTIAFTGGDGGKILALRNDGEIDYCLNVEADSIHRIQETHVTLYHIIWDLVHTFLPQM